MSFYAPTLRGPMMSGCRHCVTCNQLKSHAMSM